jgi:hypothetical protein
MSSFSNSANPYSKLSFNFFLYGPNTSLVMASVPSSTVLIKESISHPAAILRENCVTHEFGTEPPFLTLTL